MSFNYVNIEMYKLCFLFINVYLCVTGVHCFVCGMIKASWCIKIVDAGHACNILLFKHWKGNLLIESLGK